MLPYELSPAETSLALANNKEAVLLDCREAEELALASLPAATHIPLGDIPSRAHQELDPDGEIYVICHHGARSLSAAVWLRREGFEKAQSVAGGIDRWSREIDATIPRY